MSWAGRHVPSPASDVLRISRAETQTEVLGPGVRSVVWVQRCDLRCAECILPEGHGEDGGEVVGVDALAAALLADPLATGLTISGGEPFLQPAACAALIDRMRAQRPELSTMAYSGYRLEWLRRRCDPGTDALLARLDLLVDGPYIRRRHAALRWRGSANQRLILLTDRHAGVLDEPDVSAGLEVGIDHTGALLVTGVPAEPDWRPRAERALAVTSRDPRMGLDA